MLPKEEKLFLTIQQVIEGQKKKLYNIAQEIIPQITEEDLLQPNDFPELENNPYFRYEEGVLEGLYTIGAALRALFKEEM